MPTTGFPRSSPRHSSHSGFALGAGGEYTATTLPRSSPFASAMRTSPSRSPRSLTVCHKPAGVADCAAAPQAASNMTAANVILTLHLRRLH